jgi:glycosyltransferase involved in cell wall biosynthesis
MSLEHRAENCYSLGLSMGAIAVSIVMPCLNEAETLGICIKKALAAIEEAGVLGEVVVADNGSDDGSIEIATAEGARVIHVPVRGYGAALIAGFEGARGEYVLMADADDSYEFSHLPRFLDALNAGSDLVMGNRHRGGIKPGAMPMLHRYLGNPVLSYIGRLFFRIHIGDFHCGIRAFRKDAMLGLKLKTTGMEFASEMVVKASLKGLKISEVPTTLSRDGRSHAPHLRTWRDGWRHLRFLLLYSPRWLFLYPGLAAGLLGFLLTVWLLPAQRSIGRFHFDVDTLTYAMGLMLIGFHITVFAVSAKVFGTREGLLQEDPKFERLFQYVTLETGLLFGAVLLLVGFGIMVYSIELWRRTGFGPLTPTRMLRLTLPAAASLMLGVEAIFASFFLSLLGLRRT